jgi:hypothetical protein
VSATQMPLRRIEVLGSTFERPPWAGAPLRNRTVDLLLTMGNQRGCNCRRAFGQPQCELRRADTSCAMRSLAGLPPDLPYSRIVAPLPRPTACF